jgi:K+-sensing histidine kinase KdpD
MTVQRRNDYLAVLVGVVAPLVVAIALIPLRDAIGSTNVALVLMAVVVTIATTGRRLAAVLSAFSAALWFDFFQTQPYFSFTIDRHEDWVSVGLLLAAGLIVSQLAIWGRHQQSQAMRTHSEIAVLRSIAEMTANDESLDLIQTTAGFWLRDLLHARDCRYERNVGQDPATLITPNGVVKVGDLRWAVESQGLPGPELFLPVRSGGGVAGYFIVEPTPGEKVSEDSLYTAAALADQVGAATAHQHPIG